VNQSACPCRNLLCRNFQFTSPKYGGNTGLVKPLTGFMPSLVQNLAKCKNTDSAPQKVFEAVLSGRNTYQLKMVLLDGNYSALSKDESVLHFYRDWTALIPDTRNFLHPKYLNVLGAGSPKNGLAALIYDKEGKKAIAAFAFQLTELPGSVLQSYVAGPTDPSASAPKTHNAFKRFGASIIRSGLKRFSFRLLVSGNVFASSEPGYFFSDLTSIEQRGEILRATYEKAGALLKKVNDVDIELYLVSSDRSTPDLPAQDFHVFDAEPEMIFGIRAEWNSFSDYLSDLSSKYRVWAKKIIKSTENLRLETLSLEQIQQNNSLLNKLYLNVASRADFNMAWLDGDYFMRMKETFGEDFKVKVWRTEAGKVIGFHTSLLSRLDTFSALDAHFLGMDYNESKNYRLYPRILYDLVEQGIEANADVVRYGRTASESKSIIGASAHPTSYALKHRNPLFHRVLGPFLRALESPKWTARQPLKSN
jgi:hypothetical protein